MAYMVTKQAEAVSVNACVVPATKVATLPENPTPVMGQKRVFVVEFGRYYDPGWYDDYHKELYADYKQQNYPIVPSKIFCSCGRTDIAVFASSLETHETCYSCRHCGREADRVMRADGHHKIFAAAFYLDYAIVYDNGNKVSLSTGFSEYAYNHDVQKIGRKDTKIRFTFNAETGMMYALRGKRICNITYEYRMVKEGGYLDYLLSHGGEETFHQFLEVCNQKRGLHYLHTGYADLSIRMKFLLLRFPVLQSFPTYAFGELPTKYRKPLSQMTKSNDIWKLFIGLNSKVLKQLVAERDLFYEARLLGGVLKKTDNLQKIFSAVMKGDTTQHFSNPVVFPVQTQEEESEMKEALQFALDLFGEETVFVNKMLKFKKLVTRHTNAVPVRDDEPFAQPVVHYQPAHEEEVFSLSSFLFLVRDSYRMYNELIASLPDYQVPFHDDWKKMHDEMSMDMKRVKQANKIIPYSEPAIKRFNRTVEGVEFRLAEHSYRLLDVGNRLTICVGGYASRAIQKYTIIVIAYMEGKYAVCLEINNDQLIQAKIHHNHWPEKELSQIIKNYCTLAKVDARCPDLFHENAVPYKLFEPSSFKEGEIIENESPYGPRPQRVAPQPRALPFDLDELPI